MAIEQVRLKDLIRDQQKELTLDERYEYDDLPVEEPVSVQCHIKLKSTGVDVVGRYQAHVKEPCDRCFEPFEREIRRSFEDRFVYESLTDTQGTGEVELHEEDFYDTIGYDGVLDVKDLVRQHIIIALSSDRVCENETCIIPG